MDPKAHHLSNARDCKKFHTLCDIKVHHFRYPGPVTFERRESLFQETHPTDLLPLKLSTSKNITSSLVPVPGDVHSVKKDGCVLSSLAISSSALLETAAVENLNMIKLQQV